MIKTFDQILDRVSELGIKPSDKEKLKSLQITLPEMMSSTHQWRNFLAGVRLRTKLEPGDRPANLEIFGMPVRWHSKKEIKVTKSNELTTKSSP